MFKVLCFLTAFGYASSTIEFRPFYQEKKIKVEISRKGKEIPWVRGTKEYDYSADKIAAVISDFDNYGKFLGNMVETVTVVSKKKNAARLHMVWDYPFPYSDRDSVILYRYEKLKGGIHRVDWVDNVKEGDPSDGTRIDRVEGFTIVTPLDKKRSKVVYTYYGDLGAKFSESINIKAWKKEPVKYFEAITAALSKPKKKEAE